MHAFEYCIPTRIVFGENTVSKVGTELKAYGKKVLLVSYEKSLLETIGCYKTIMTACAQEGLEVFEKYGIKSNPTIEFVRECAKFCKDNEIDVILAVGGGSVIDSCKFISAAAKTDDDPWDFFTGKATITASLPLVVISTIPATSSEMNSGAVITNEKLERKEGMYSPFFFPKVSILDPTLTYSLPKKLTAYSMADAMSHLLEGYLTHRDDNASIQDGIMETLMKSIMSSTLKVQKDGNDKAARATLMWACALAWNGFPVAGVGLYGAPMHVFGHSLSALYDTPHGASLSIVMPHWMRYNLKTDLAPYVKLARNVFALNDEDDNVAAAKAIDCFEKWLEEIGAPTSFAKFDIPTDNILKLAENAAVTAKAWGLEEWNDVDKLVEVYNLCR